VATHKVSPLPSPPQFSAANNLDTCEIARQSFAPTPECSLYLALIQQSVRRWEKPWRHQRAIVLFAHSPEETKLRLQLEGRVRHGERVLQIIPVGE
jgi:hypothetical protein